MYKYTFRLFMSKIINLFRDFPPKGVLTSFVLAQKGYSTQLMQKYLKSGWVERLGDGAYKKSNEEATWQGALWALQQEKEVYVSGKTALELQGYEHFLNLGRRTVYVTYVPPTNIPKWLKKSDFLVDFVFISTQKIKPVYLNDISMDELSLKISCVELAILEICEKIPQYYTYESAYYFFESLTSLRPEIAQSLLEESTSIKAKRLFLHFAARIRHQWFHELDLALIHLGSSIRQIVKGGQIDSAYLITFPKTTE